MRNEVFGRDKYRYGSGPLLCARFSINVFDWRKKLTEIRFKTLACLDVMTSFVMHDTPLLTVKLP